MVTLLMMNITTAMRNNTSRLWKWLTSYQSHGIYHDEDSQFGLAMPDELKDYDNPIQSYRDYYHLDKATFATWSHRAKPDWWNEDYADYDKRITAK
jgi:hypothetical protein